MRGIIILILFLFPLLLCAQLRYTKLTLKPHQVFEIGPSDIIVADTLEMMDSSKIQLNNLKSENYIRVNVAIFGNNTKIDGNGSRGKMGKDGPKGRTHRGPCRNGSAGLNGARGFDGESGINLFLYIDKVIVNGNLVIDLSGGNGGDGGEGGEGGGGSPGTLHCYGGNGGNGGNGGDGGNGGNGGTLTFGGADMDIMRMMIGGKIIINTLGGNLGYGGIYGMGGAAGMGPSNMDGKAGIRGRKGERGKPGTNGVIQFEQQ